MKEETREWIEGIKVYLEMQKKLKAGVVELCNIYVANYHEKCELKVHIYENIEKIAEELGIAELEVDRNETGCSVEVYFMFEGLMFFQLVYTLPIVVESTISLEEFKMYNEEENGK